MPRRPSRQRLPAIRPRGPRVPLPRRRREPEEARREILDAAERVFGEFQPDQVGLKDVAPEAGVSHALITHYFGTYAGLIEAALERRLSALRELILQRLHEANTLSRPGHLIAALFEALEDPVHLRLVRWLLASERPSAAHAFGLHRHGLQIVARQVAQALNPHASAAFIDKLELTMLTAVSAAYGYAIAKYALVGALGRQVSATLDADVRDTLTNMVRAHVRAELGIDVEAPTPRER